MEKENPRLILNKNKAIHEVNSAFCIAFSFDNKELIGKDFEVVNASIFGARLKSEKNQQNS